MWEAETRSLRRGLSTTDSLAPWEWRQVQRSGDRVFTNNIQETAEDCSASIRRTKRGLRGRDGELQI